jgi:ABC-type multidrug transport system fused ATPase/permease subunit
VARFAVTSLGRAALTAVSILLIRQFLAGVLGQKHELAERFGVESALWITAALLLLANLGSAALNYDSQISEQKIVKAIELGTMERLIHHMPKLSVGFLDRQTHGNLLQSIRQDVSQMRSVVLATASVVLEALQAIGLVVAEPA